ncbi:FtsK/SpoIIIE domain-containing protein [Mycobacterium cookii]|uniref:FtsK/SpoIIIE domain-containing protein n=1 Tax=Nocardioides furvisabuli TaxID=375542 RepID=A0ABP5ITY9_9ACTN|nr:FtsK/SpoIIIE domain-containing protein [Nocardioides furvisabuli]
MKLKLTYVRAVGRATDVVVTTDATATVGDLARELLDSDPMRSPVPTVRDAVTLSVGADADAPRVTIPAGRTVGETSLTSGCAVAVVDATPAPSAQGHEAAAVLRIVAGPDAPREVRLPLGPSFIGRDPSADVVLDDPFVSKQHARVEVGATIELVDLNSANGLSLDGGLVTRLTVLPGQEVVLGDSTLTFALTAAPAPRQGPEASGSAVNHSRSPRVEARYLDQEHPRPSVPTEVEQQPFPWLLLVAPVLMGVGMYAVTRNPLSLMFIAMAPLMMLGNFATTRGRSKRQLAGDIEKFERQLDILRTTLTSEVPREREVRQAEAPHVSDVYQAGFDRSPLLWTRRPEHWNFLHVRLGLGRLPSRNTIAGAGPSDEGLPEYTQRLMDVEREFRHIDGVPVIEDLVSSGALGVVGGQTEVADALRGLLVQLTGLHSPAELVVTALAPPHAVPQHEWLAWLPHTSSPQSPIIGTHLADSAATAGQVVAQLEELVAVRLGRATADGPTPRGPLGAAPRATRTGGSIGSGEGGSKDAEAPVSPVVVVVIESEAPADRARLVQLSERAAEAGVLPIWVAPRAADLPAVCRTFVDVTGGLGDGAIHFVRHGAVVSPAAVEGVSVEHAERFARALTPLVDSGALVADASDLPQQVPLVSLLGDDLVDSSAAVVDRWRQNGSLRQRGARARKDRARAGTLRALVGASGVDAMHLDLRAQGPHALVGGTTGSGKSEFLQAWVLGMAAEFSPDRVTFLFVDYKGGAAFADCVRLPHCVGLVTDLNSHLVRRALTSLRAEIRKREHLLNDKSAKDLLELEKRGDPECPPALVLVIDEFAALANEVPEFVDGVIDIAARGRSLGIHLIMATQRPAGVIKDNLRANTNLRIALRMADESDSSDVIGTPDAAVIDPDIPGRGVVKTGPGRLAPFQSAYAGGRTIDEHVRPTITIHRLGFGSDTPWEPVGRDVEEESAGEQAPTDQVRLVASIDKAARLAEIEPPERPWLDELAPAYHLNLLGEGPRTDTELIIGLADLPDDQKQDVVFFRPDDDGNLAIYGTGGSGKSVLLRTLAAGAGVTPRGGPVDVYAIDCAAGGLRMLEQLPHVGAVISGEDNERVVRLFRRLRDIAHERAQTFRAADAESITEYRANAGRPEEPRILLLVDGFASFRDQWEMGMGRAEWYGVFQTLLSEGRQLGIHVVFTADRPAAVPGSVAASVPRRVVLRLAEEAMYMSLDVPDDVVTSTSPPGRAVVDGHEVQVAILGGSRNASDQAQAIGKLARAMERRGRASVAPIETLPSEVPLDSLPASVGGAPVLGVSDETLGPIGFRPTGTFLISGGPQSGRTTALTAMVKAIRRADPTTTLVYLGNRRSALPNLIDWDQVAVTPADVAETAKELANRLPDITHDKYIVVVEGLAEHATSPTDVAIVDLVRAVKRSDHMIIGEAEASSWMSSFPIYGELKSGRTGLVLQPDGDEGQALLRTPFPRVARREFPPGRGLAVLEGKVVRVQLPLP